MNKSPLKRLIGYTLRYKVYLIISILSAIISSICLLYSPILIGDAIDEMIGYMNVDFDAINSIIFRLVIITIIYIVSSWLLSFFTTILSNKTVYDIRIEAFNKLQVVPLKYIDSSLKGEIISRIIGDVENISNCLIQTFTQLFSGIVIIVLTILFMMISNYKLGLVVTLLTPLSLFVASFISKGNHRMLAKQLEYSGKLNAYSTEIIENAQLIKLFNYEEEAMDNYRKINKDLNKWGYYAQIFNALTNPSTRFINAIVYAVVGVLGAIFVINDKTNTTDPFTIGSLYIFLSYATQYTKPFNDISNVINEFQMALVSSKRVFQIIDQENELCNSSYVNLDSVKGNIKFENVCFSYDPNKKLIENFNLDVKKGEKIAIVGPTGCGKTTLINLIMRFYDVNSGAIYLDGTNINDIKRQDLRNNFGMVLQDTWLFNGTIFDNIAYGKKDANINEVIEACKKARIHSYIERLENGYDTLLNESNTLSAGQKQLMCIARVMLLNPALLILDEATSSIDTLTEIEIQKAFQEIMKDRTSFIIAHRLQTIVNSDKILVMKDGNVIEVGNHQELLDKKGFYYDLYNSQYQK